MLGLELDFVVLARICVWRVLSLFPYPFPHPKLKKHGLRHVMSPSEAYKILLHASSFGCRGQCHIWRPSGSVLQWNLGISVQPCLEVKWGQRRLPSAWISRSGVYLLGIEVGEKTKRQMVESMVRRKRVFLNRMFPQRVDWFLWL